MTFLSSLPTISFMGPRSRSACPKASQNGFPWLSVFISLGLAVFMLLPLAAQKTPPPPPPPPAPAAPPPAEPAPILGPHQLDQLVTRIALYPDPLLAQVLTASTYWNEIPEAADWANQHSYLKGDALAEAIQVDNLEWDPSVLALLPFPSVLSMMAQDPALTQQLGDAVLAQHPDVSRRFGDPRRNENVRTEFSRSVTPACSPVVNAVA